MELNRFSFIYTCTDGKEAYYKIMGAGNPTR